MEKLKLESADMTEQNINKIAELFPNVITETKDADGNIKKAINFTVLQQMLQADLVEGDENYEFTWVGKKQSIIDGNKPIRKTLRPCPEESKDWDKTENLYFEGDNLEVLKLLQGSYLNAIKMIYIDPPYNTGKDLVYRDNFTSSKGDFEEDLGLYDDDENRLFQNNESNGRFHSDWCSMIYPRIQLARNLLTDDGVIFISIDNNELNNLIKICNEVFGEENFIECITWNKRIPKNDKGIGNIHEYILIYVKNKTFKHQFVMQKDGLEEIDDLLVKLKSKKIQIKDAESEIKKLYNKNGYDRGITLYNSLDSNYRLWGKINMSWPNADTFGPTYSVLHPKTLSPVKIPDRGWRWKEDTFNDAAKLVDGKYTEVLELHDGSFVCGKIWFDKNGNTQPSSIIYLDDVNSFLLRSILSLKSDGGIEVENLFEGKSYFSYPKPTKLLNILIGSFVEYKNFIVLDFFSGSSTTAHSVMQLNSDDGGNRKFIMVQLPELCDEKSEAFKAGYKTICDIGKERIRRAGKKIKENIGLKGQNLDTGFRVFKVDSTNMKDVYYGAGEYNQQMLLDLENNIKNDRNDLDLLYGVLLDWGVSLALPHTNEMIGGVKVHFVNGVDLVACFADNITEEVIRDIATRKPLRVVFRDSSFANSPDKINVTEIFKTLSPETTVKVI